MRWTTGSGVQADRSVSEGPLFAPAVGGGLIGHARVEGAVGQLLHGIAAAEEELRASIEETRTAITSGLEQLNEAIRAHLKDLEPLVVEFALDVAESILADELTDGAKRAAEQDLARAVEQLAGDGAIDVYVHPVDLLRLQESGFVGQVSGAISGIRWHADDAMEEGDWSAKSSMAAVRRVRAEMLNGIRERLDLDRNVPEEL